MRKRLLVFALLIPLATVGVLAGQDAPKGTPRQGIAKASGGENGPKQPDPQNANQPPNTMPATSQPTTPTGDEARQQARENLKIQWELALFTGLLVFVGLLQVGTMFWQAWLLKGTKEKIQVQAGHMERQTKALEDSVAAAQKSADAVLAQIEIMKRKERAQLSIEFSAPEWVFNEELGGYPIRFQVTLEGSTRAYVPQSVILAYMGRTARTKRTAYRDMGLPRRLTPEMSPFESNTLISTDEGWPETDTAPGKADLVENHNFTVFVDGSIWYRDIFGDEWMLEIDRCWVPNSRHGDKGAIGGMWVPFGSGKDDGHRKVEQQKPEPQKTT